MNRNEYHKIKRYIMTLCKDNILELADKVGLTEYETKVLLHINKNDSRVCISLDLGVCESKCTKDCRKIFTKIYDYLKRTHQ